MCACEHIRQVGAYHDGELGPEEKRLFEAHLARCPACALELEELRGLSRLLAGARIPDAPAEVIERLHETPGAVRERVALRLAGWLTGAAAAVLLICAVWMWSGRARSEEIATAPNSWELAAVAPAVETPWSESQQIAQWIVEDLSLENGHD